VTKVKKNPNLLAELQEARELNMQKEKNASAAIVELYQRDEYLSSIKYIQERL
jgi:hypothetical protein